ncbi:hypothetical protein TNCV_4075511 [Trichonephila clavipes]|nr:hypothetical protein TNCV_4075511 [Trichonephila clavipes]
MSSGSTIKILTRTPTTLDKRYCFRIHDCSCQTDSCSRIYDSSEIHSQARRVVSSHTPVSGKSYAAVTKKSYESRRIQCDESTCPASEKSNSTAVDTIKTVSTPPNIKKPSKTEVKESGVMAKKREIKPLEKTS